VISVYHPKLGPIHILPPTLTETAQANQRQEISVTLKLNMMKIVVVAASICLLLAFLQPGMFIAVF